MAEVFQGIPAIVNVAISDQEGRKIEYNVCGRDLKNVEEAVRLALQALPDPDEPIKTKKTRKPRRTKEQMAAAAIVVPPDGVPPAHRKKHKMEPVGAGSVWPG